EDEKGRTGQAPRPGASRGWGGRQV
ncbi:hypothetical protein C360_05653, partial [Cryptococcus neoformans Bt15]